MSETEFVTTAAIKRAVAGRETEVLDGLGINWRSGRPHIQCPYRDHVDTDPSWRWDDRHHKAHCTCSAGDDIFDVAAKIDGGDFDAAKLRIARILHRDDLIRTNGQGDGKQYQATDAKSLLNAPANRRDDTLPINYLAHRLEVDPSAVPIPATPMRGLKALGYWDPPAAGSKDKPVLVGEFSCAIYFTVAADGKIHAHRIYLAPDGRGKADLGTGPDGRPRNPKKSAKVVDGDNTAGRSALWGVPHIAPHIILTEGIETGAAVALALAAEIAANEIAVAAAITAGGIEAFQLYPATTRVTVAADRDEAPKADGKPGSRRGELAARAFAIKHRERLKVAIVLPGAVGQSIDWLDVLRRDGAEAVRAGIFAAAAFVPTEAEVSEAEERQGRAAELRRIEGLYPLPFIEGMRLRYQHTRDGRIAIYKFAGQGQDGRERWERKCSPIGVSAQLRMADAENVYGLRVAIQDMDAEPRALDFDRADLARMAAVDIRTKFFGAGLQVEGDGEHVAIQILKAAAPKNVIAVVSRPGWHFLPDPVFATPAGEVFGAVEHAIELAVGARLSARAAKAGTLDGWQEAVAVALAIDSCQHWTLGIIAGFAGPILALCRLDTCGINFSGATSVGKTTAQQLGASAWSSPLITDGGLLRSMRSTENSVEALAQGSHGTFLGLDEMAHADGKAIGRILYSLAGNAGKSRMRADATMRQSYSWSTFAVLSGESSLEDKVRADGGNWTGGMAVRFADIDLTGVSHTVPADQLDRLRKISAHYGHAGPEFVRRIFETGLQREAAALKDKVLRAASNLAGAGAQSAKIRAAVPLALLSIAGQLAQSLGVLPAAAKVRERVEWAWKRYASSSGAMVLEPEEQALEALRTYIHERWNVTLKNTLAETGVNNREAIGWYDNNTVYLPTARLREACKEVLKEQYIAQVLRDRDLLSQQGDAAKGRIAVRYVPKIGHVQSYALKREYFGREVEVTPKYGRAANAD
jgi:hypothetical protein